MIWDEEKVSKLKELWGKGNTASQIAEIIGGISRNAVIGKAHRLNLSAKIKTRSSATNKNFDNSIEDKNVKSFLLQGDSWIESISEYKKSETLFRDYGLNKNLNFYNAGITSFAPSLMHLQYKILKRDYNINPNFILIYIDHTDIGDEFCRYKKNKVY